MSYLARLQDTCDIVRLDSSGNDGYSDSGLRSETTICAGERTRFVESFDREAGATSEVTSTQVRFYFDPSVDVKEKDVIKNVSLYGMDDDDREWIVESVVTRRVKGPRLKFAVCRNRDYG